MATAREGHGGAEGVQARWLCGRRRDDLPAASPRGARTGAKRSPQWPDPAASLEGGGGRLYPHSLVVTPRGRALLSIIGELPLASLLW